MEEDNTLSGTLVRIERNGFGVVKLDHTPAIGVFTGFDRSPDVAGSAYRPGVRIRAAAGESHGSLLYLRDVKVTS